MDGCGTRPLRWRSELVGQICQSQWTECHILRLCSKHIKPIFRLSVAVSWCRMKLQNHEYRNSLGCVQFAKRKGVRKYFFSPSKTRHSMTSQNKKNRLWPSHSDISKGNKGKIILTFPILISRHTRTALWSHVLVIIMAEDPLGPLVRRPPPPQLALLLSSWALMGCWKHPSARKSRRKKGEILCLQESHWGS